MYKELKEGHQVYVIAPLIEDSDNSSSNETELMWLITNTFKKKQSSSKNITFMNNSLKKKGWCLRID